MATVLEGLDHREPERIGPLSAVDSSDMFPVPSIYSSARTELAKLLIYGLFRKIRVLAQDGIDARKAYDELVAKWTPLAPAVVRSLAAR